MQVHLLQRGGGGKWSYFKIIWGPADQQWRVDLDLGMHWMQESLH